jgi:glycosyltransferase involved in cell wall biosynthesis
MTTHARPLEWPLVSVVIPTRGRPELLRIAVGSVVAQTYPGPIECFVVHDQEPPDHALEALGTEQRSVTVMTNTRRPGLAASRNAGLDKVSGSLVASLDDDDLWHPAKLEVQVARMLREPDLVVLGAGIRLLMPAGRIVEWPGSHSEVQLEDLLRSRMKELHSSTLLIRRSVFAEVGPYDEALPNSYAEDYEFLLRAIRAGRVGVVNQPLADVRKDGPSWFRDKGAVVAEALEYLLRQHPELATSRRGHARILGQIAFARATLKQRGPALRWAARAFSRWPVAPHAGLAVLQSVIGVDPRWALKSARAAGRGIS